MIVTFDTFIGKGEARVLKVLSYILSIACSFSPKVSKCWKCGVQSWNTNKCGITIVLFPRKNETNERFQSSIVVGITNEYKKRKLYRRLTPPFKRSSFVYKLNRWIGSIRKDRFLSSRKFKPEHLNNIKQSSMFLASKNNLKSE